MNPKYKNHLVPLIVALMILLLACGKAQQQKQDDSTSSKASALKEDKNSKPKIVAEQEVFNFGRVEQDTNVEHTFTVKNTGTGVLQIEKAHGS